MSQKWPKTTRGLNETSSLTLAALKNTKTATKEDWRKQTLQLYQIKQRLDQRRSWQIKTGGVCYSNELPSLFPAVFADIFHIRSFHLVLLLSHPWPWQTVDNHSCFLQTRPAQDPVWFVFTLTFSPKTKLCLLPCESSHLIPPLTFTQLHLILLYGPVRLDLKLIFKLFHL